MQKADLQFVMGGYTKSPLSYHEDKAIFFGQFVHFAAIPLLNTFMNENSLHSVAGHQELLANSNIKSLYSIINPLVYHIS